MGDRANVAIRDDGKDVWFYTHWQGTELPEIVRTALAKRWRWDDAAYLARIVFCEMVKDDVSGELAYGISTTPTDTTPVLVVDVDKQRVYYGSTEDIPASLHSSGVSFEDFVGMDAPLTWKAIRKASDRT